MRGNPFSGRGESGQALVLVVIILLVSALVIPSLLNLNFSGTRSAQISEEKMLRLYAADAGIEDALYQIRNRLEGNVTQKNYSLAGDMNRSDVDVTIYQLGDEVYRITSTATDISGISTEVESYVSFLDYTFLTEYALATRGDIEIGSNGVIEGDVRCGNVDNHDAVDGIIDPEEIRNWPTATEITGFYIEDVDGLDPYEGNPKAEEYRVNGSESNPTVIEPLYRIGELKFIGNNKHGQLTDIVYVDDDAGGVDGDLNVGPGVTIDLNGRTIFVEGAISMAPNAGFIGSGCIIAIGDIGFQPHAESGEDDFIFIMSIEGSINVQPGGTFYGTIAAAGDITFQPGCGVFQPGEPPDTLHLPGMDEDTRQIATIETYTIITGG